jgi:hypothetical protein
MELECAEDIDDFTPSPSQVSYDMEIEEYDDYDLDGKRYNSRRKKVKSKSPTRKKKSSRKQQKSPPKVRKSTRKQRKSPSQRKQVTRKSRK